MPALAHIGIGLAAKRIDPKLPLWALLVSAMFLDLLIIFVFWTGISTILTHSLLMAVIWTVIVIVGVLFISKRDIRKSVLIGLVVFSHWVLDFIGWPMTFGGLNPAATGVPVLLDMNLTIGVGVYSTIAGALIMDLGVFILGLFIYIRTPKDTE